MMTRVAAVLAMMVAVAHADRPAPGPLNPHPHAGFGGGLALGAARERGRDAGWVARLDYELLPALAEPGRFGGAFGFEPSLQIWRAGGDWGVGLPIAIALGVRAPHVRVEALIGVEVISIEQVDDDTGVGLYQPLAGLTAMVEIAGWHAGVDGRVTRRWQIGAPDHTQWTGTFFVGRTWETPLTEPVR